VWVIGSTIIAGDCVEMPSPPKKKTFS